MWLDRFSGQSTPVDASPPHSRNYSPGPKRPSHLGLPHRPVHSTNASRSSTSLDLSANTSTASLSATTRVVNGSSLRNEQRPPPDIPDPLRVLNSVLGLSSDADFTSKTAAKATRPESQPDVLRGTDFGSLSLEEFLEQSGSRDDDNAAASPEASRTRDGQEYEGLHESISECDEVLESVEAYLTKFQTQLAHVSAEIESLQSRSIQLNAQLENRRTVEKLLGPAVEQVSLAPRTVRAIAEGPVDDQFLQALREVETRSAAIKSHKMDPEHIKAVEDVKPLLEDLKTKAVERVRDFIVAQIKTLRSPNTNAQVVQQQTFLRYKELYSFLARNHATLAEEIGQAYVNTMKWYYSSSFTRYQQALDKMKLHLLDQQDLLGTEPTNSRRGALPASKGVPPQHDAHNIGRRADVLRSSHETALPSYLAEDGQGWHYLETPFRNFNLALIDNLCVEYSISSELFAATSFNRISRRVVDIFEPTFSLGHNLTKRLVENTTDCLGVLLCVRLNQHSAFEMQRRKIPVADSYINYTNMLLWPRFQKIMDMHCDSLKKITAANSRGASAAFSLVGGSEASKASLAPHAVTQRFSQMLQGILVLSAEAGDDEPVANSLARLRTEYEALLSRLAKGVASDPTKRDRFLYNNYSLILTIISDTQGKLAEEQKEHFVSLMKDTKTR